MKREKNLPAKFRFTRTVFGVIMILAVFFSWGKYIVAILGFLFIISAITGYCVTCKIYEKFRTCSDCK
jgi:uncharacterized iron-regulated membrane protein